MFFDLRMDQSVSGHDALEAEYGKRIETPQVPVERVDASYAATGKTRKKRIGGQAFHPKYARFAEHIGVDESSKLRMHRINYSGALFQMPESLGQFFVQANLSQVPAKRNQTGHRGKIGVWIPVMNLCRVRPADLTTRFLHYPARSRLASGCDSTYLLDTRRLVGFCFHGDYLNHRAEYLIPEKKRFFRFFSNGAHQYSQRVQPRGAKFRMMGVRQARLLTIAELCGLLLSSTVYAAKFCKHGAKRYSISSTRCEDGKKLRCTAKDTWKVIGKCE